MWTEERKPIPVEIISGYDARLGHILVITIGDIKVPILISSNN